jgi:hypothetical protein
LHAVRRLDDLGASPDDLEDCPRGLIDALAARGASVVSSWREPPRVYMRGTTREGSLFARYTTDVEDQPTMAHEAAAREVVGTERALRAPAVLARGRSWLLETGIRAEPAEGATAVDAIASAAAILPGLRLPEAPEGRRRGGPVAAIRRAALLGRSALESRDLLASRRILARPGLESVTIHGDFHVGNILLSRGVAWVVDWELCGRGPAGLDLMQCWATLDRAEDRERLFEAALRQVGERRRPELLRLRYAVLVRTIAAKVAAPAEFDRDPEGAAKLVRVLPGIREQARREA